MHCGLCLEACPTYRELRVEMDSPRGRIYLMKGLLEGKLAPEEKVLKHLDQCLDCRACETACPSGVEYAHILERTRTVLAPHRKLGPAGRLFRWFGLSRVLLPSRAVQALVFKLLWLQQRLGLVRLGGWLASRQLLPGRLAGAARQAPPVPCASFRAAARAAPGTAPAEALVFPARGESRHRVALVTGCLADQLLAEVNAATVRVLTENGCEVEVLARRGLLRRPAHPQRRPRSGAGAGPGQRAGVPRSRLRRHRLERRRLQRRAAPLRRAAGRRRRRRPRSARRCGTCRSSCARSASGRRPAPGPLTGTVAYDEPCHLLHAQKISEPPRQLLRAIPGLHLVPLDDADACCGSAGAYSLLQPDLAGRIGDRKIAAIAPQRRAASSPPATRAACCRSARACRPPD